MLAIAKTGNVFVDAITSIVTNQIFIMFLVIAVGYLIGRINIKGVSFGSSGVFVIALIVGILIAEIGLDKFGWKDGGVAITQTVKNVGLGLFITGVGYISGPTFIRNFKKKALSYIAISSIIIVTGTLICIVLLALDPNLETHTALGVLMGALSSTPGLAAATSLFPKEEFPGVAEEISAASGLAYPFGVLGVVLFVQFVPKLLRADLSKERAKMSALLDDKKKSATAKRADDGELDCDAIVAESKPAPAPKKLFKLDSFGICAFSVAIALGMLLGAITLPLGRGLVFSLGTTGGALIIGLLFGHFRHVGPVSIDVPKQTLNIMREFGLVLFLTGTGIEGGFKFFAVLEIKLFIYGVIISLVPMIVGFVVSRFAFKLELLNSLGSICGGMTSTPALGALIYSTGTDDVGHSYAATYPIALFLLVFVPQLIVLIF